MRAILSLLVNSLSFLPFEGVGVAEDAMVNGARSEFTRQKKRLFSSSVIDSDDHFEHTLYTSMYRFYSSDYEYAVHCRRKGYFD